MTRSIKSVICLITLITTGACAKEEAPAQKPFIPPVKVETIASDPGAAKTRVFNGIAAGVEESTVSFRVGDVMITRPGEVGDVRKQGEVIATLDPRNFIFAVENLEGELSAAQAELDILLTGARQEEVRKLEAQIQSLKSTLVTAELEYQRVQQLYASDAAAKSRLDQAKSDKDLAEANLKAMQEELEIALTGGREEEIRAQRAKIQSIQSQLDQARADLEDTVLKMPYDGIISAKHATIFEQVAKHQKVFDIVEIDQIEVKVSIPEGLITHIKKGQTVTVEFLTLPGKKYKGTIVKVGLAADKLTLTYPVWVRIPNPESEILPGMSAEVTIRFKDIKIDNPLLPIYAVLEDKVTRKKVVWVYDPKTSTAKRRNVTAGRIIENKIEITRGVKKGDKIIVAGLDRLKEGMEVRLPKPYVPERGADTPPADEKPATKTKKP